jgi:WD40 repeat protein
MDSASEVRRWAFDSPVTSLQFSPDGEWLAATTADGKLRSWSVQTGATRLDTVADTNGVYSVDVSPDGLRIGTGGLQGDVRLWSAASSRTDLTLRNAGCEQADCRAHVAFDRTSKRVVVASGDKIWLHDLDFTTLKQQAIAELKKRPNIQSDCARVLRSDRCPGF